MSLNQTFPSDIAYDAMGTGGHRYEQHRKQKKTFTGDLGLAHSPNPFGDIKSYGRGVKLQFRCDAIAHGAISLRLIDCGIEVVDAYTAAAFFAFTAGNGDATTHFDPSAGQRFEDRAPGCLFGVGETWLVYYRGEHDGPNLPFSIISDANPAYGASEASALNFAIWSTGGDDSAPRALINLTRLCDSIAEKLGVDRQKAFGGGRRGA